MPTESFEDYLALRALFASGDISKATKQELERYAVMLSRPRAHIQIGDESFSEVCETVRTLLMVRMSEEANVEATRISQIALWIAMAALGCSVLQVFSPFLFR